MMTEQAVKKPGRPAKNGVPMTQAERAAEYRANRLHASIMAVEEHKSTTVQALLDGLEWRLAWLNDPARSEFDQTAAKSGAEVIIKELCSRHNLKLKK